MPVELDGKIYTEADLPRLLAAYTERGVEIERLKGERGWFQAQCENLQQEVRDTAIAAEARVASLREALRGTALRSHHPDDGLPCWCDWQNMVDPSKHRELYT
jgi:hypothetical protein